MLVKTQKHSSSEENRIEVERHKTAISRYALSKPMQTLIEHGLITEQTSVFDYGCGQGGDLRGLLAMGYKADGWDPVFFPDRQKHQADIVNLGFVLNTIEEPAERNEVLIDAFSLCKQMLVASSMISTSATVDAGRPYRDGILTSRNTFQKYFQQEELQQYIEDVLETSAVAVAPGIFYVFRSPSDQQQFLSSRSKRHINWEELSQRLYPARPRRMKTAERLYEENMDLLEAFWGKMIDLGRVPIEAEFERYDEVREKIGTPNRARKIFIEKYGSDTIKEAFRLRREDLLVYLALSAFRKKVPFRSLPGWLQTDIKTFFGSYANALDEGKQMLFVAGNPSVITELCDRTEFGYLDQQALYVHKSLVDEFPPILRIYLGCAEILHGHIQVADVIKIHKRSGKVTLLMYDDFDNAPLPMLQERVKIDMVTQQIHVFDHRSMPEQQLLYFKERYISKDHPKRARWEKLSRKLRELGLSEEMGYGPTKQQFETMLKEKGEAGS